MGADRAELGAYGYLGDGSLSAIPDAGRVLPPNVLRAGGRDAGTVGRISVGTDGHGGDRIPAALRADGGRRIVALYAVDARPHRPPLRRH